MNGETQGRTPKAIKIQSHEDQLRATAQETLRQWTDIHAWCARAGDPRVYVAAFLVASASTFLADTKEPKP